MQQEHASVCAITRYSKDAINKLAIVAGLWQQLTAHLLPSSLLPGAAVDGLHEKFRQSAMLKGSLFDDVWQLSQQEIHDGVEDVAGLLPFVQKHLGELRRVQAEHRKELREAEANHPMNLMTQQEMTQLTTDLYMGKFALDVNSYRSALQKLAQHRASEEDAFVASEAVHIKNVQAAQAQMAQSDVVFVSPPLAA